MDGWKQKTPRKDHKVKYSDVQYERHENDYWCDFDLILPTPWLYTTKVR
jgi:hypothetical protein